MEVSHRHGRYRQLAHMGDPDPENGDHLGEVTHKRTRSYVRSPSRGNDSAEFVSTKQKSFKCARNKDKRSKKLDELKSDLKGLPKDERRRLCQETDERGNTAFHYAVKAGNLEVCKELYRNGANVNARGQNKMRPLQFAARYGDEHRPEDVWHCMKWIMEVMESSQKSDGKRSGVETARNRILRKPEKEDVFEKDKYDFSLLHHAIQNTNWEETPIVAERLLETGMFKVTETDKQGNTSLHLAAEFDKQERHRILDVFLEKDKSQRFRIDGEDLEACIKGRNKQGKTPLHIACAVGNPDSVAQLLEAAKTLGVDIPSIINSPDNDGQHPLHLAIESGNVPMMKILMKEGVVVSKEAINCAVRYFKRTITLWESTSILTGQAIWRCTKV